MPRMSKTHPMTVSMIKGDAYKIAYFVWDEASKGYYVKDTVAKKRYGPFKNIHEANESGDVEIKADMGRRAGIKMKPRKPYTRTIKGVPSVVAVETVTELKSDPNTSEPVATETTTV